MNELIKIPDSITKTSMKSEAQKIVDIVIDGNAAPMDVYLQIKVYEEMIKTIKAGIKDFVFEDADKYINDDLFPAKISISQTGDRLDYESDQEYSDIKKALSLRQEKLKAAFEQSKKGLMSIDENTGEEITVCPVKKESEAIVKMTFKK